ncbi:MAG: murein biosynthesis integral membrane protein MurJ [Methylophilaceae bacterium]|nr:murein biosynthesis integral membrane protein MurJ [Methylophilaceae bacterium]MDG1821218.1 murein biosynthesis integral membrane protein MurJ [Methylophilaceae bacterium]
MNLLKTLFTVGSMTFISRILGFVRDTLMAGVFGAGLLTDAFIVAFRIPNFLRRISAEGAFSQAFVPILAEYKQQRTHNETKALINHVATLLGLFLVLLTIAGMLAAPWVVEVTAPGFVGNPSKFDLTVDLLRVTFPYILLISLVSLAGGVLNTYGNFTTPAFTPVWLNVSFIVAMLFVAPYFDNSIRVLAWAVFVGGILQLLYQLPYLQQLGLLPKMELNLHDRGVWRILRLMGPAVFGVSVGQISILINTMIASFLVSGSVSWLYFADRLMEFPTGLLGVALGTILLPSLSKSVADKNDGEYSHLLDWGLRLTFMLALPAAVALAVLAVPLVTSLFMYGAFTAHDVIMTKVALMAYSFGLLGLILVKVLAPGFYARQNIKTPVKVALFTLLVTQLMNVLFVFVLDFKEFKHAGLALAIGLGACLNASLLFYHLRKEGLYQPQAGWARFITKLLLAVTVMGVAVQYAAGADVLWFEYGLLEKMLRLLALLSVGIGSYFAMLWIMGIRIKDFIRRTAL